MMKKLTIQICMMVIAISGIAQTIVPGTRSNRSNGTFYDMTSWDSSPFEDYTYTSPIDSLGWINFRMLKPKNYTPSPVERYPLFVFLHGYGEAGRRTVGDVFYATNDPKYDNNDYQLYHCAQQHISAKNSGKFPGFVIFPQNDYGSWVTGNGFGSEPIHKNLAKVMELVDKMMTEYPIDPFRIYVNGLSNGGAATWASIYKRPDLFAAAAPMSAPGDTSMIPLIGNIPVWIFQGGLDVNPPTWRSELMFKETNKKFGDIRYTLYPNNGHDTWNSAYSEPDFFSWFLSKRKNDIHIWGEDSTICTGGGVRLSVSAGLDEYEWSNGATTNEIFVTSVGTYSVRMRRGAIWSDWSKPVNIKQRANTDPAIIVPAQSIYLPSPASSNVVLGTSVVYESYTWSTGAKTPTIVVTTPGTYSVNVKTKGKCVSTVTVPLVVKNTNATGRPNLPISIVAKSLSENSIQLNWSDNNTTEIGIEIYRSTVSAGGYKFVGIAPANAVQFIDAGLAASTDYYYRIRAINNVGASNTSVFVTSKTNVDLVAPSAPSNLTIAIGATAVLSWDASTDNVGIYKYLVYKNGVLADSTANLTTYTAKNLAPGTRYVFTVRAKDQTKNLSPFSNQVSAITSVNGLDYSFYTGTWNNLPSFTSPMVPSVTGIINNFSIGVSPVADSYAFKFQGYLKINKTGTYTFFTNSDDGSKLYIGGFSTANQVVNNDYLQAPTERSGTKAFSALGYYPIYVTFFEKTGGQTLEVRYTGPANSGISKQLIPDSVLFRGIPSVLAAAPQPATNVQLSLSTASTPVVSVSWTNSAAGLKTEIYRSTSASSGFSLIKIVGADSTTFSDKNFVQGFTYYYKLKSTGVNGESSFTPLSSIFVALFPPAATNLNKTILTDKSVGLSWIDNATNETYYLVQRKTGTSDYATIATLGANTTSYTDTNQLQSSITYSYRVIASNSSGNSHPSNELLVTIPLPSLAYQGDWKMAALQAFDSYSLSELEQALLTKQDYLSETAISPASTRTITMQLPAMPEGGMMIYNIENNVSTSIVKLFVSNNSTNGTDGSWNEVVGNYLTERDNDLQKVDFPIATTTNWYKVQFINNGTIDISLKEVGLYAFKPGVRHNYILLLGASIEEGSGGYTDFRNEILAQFPGSQPVVFNLSESGSFAGGLLAKLQSILDRHPKAGYAMIHMGGNDVTSTRPLTYAKINTPDIQNDFLGTISDIIRKCQNANKITVHARISFRDYRTEPKVKGGLSQEYGSLPFNILFDKVIKELTPVFYDTTERRPRMDLYEATLNDQSIIAGDGIHPTGTRGIRLVRKWVNSPIRYFYTGSFPAPIPYTEFNNNLGDSAESAVIKAEISKRGEDIFNARIIVEQLSNTGIRVPLHKRLDQLESGVILPVPLAPTSLFFTAIGTKSVQLNWIDNATNETFYKVSRSIGDTNNYQLVNTLLKQNTTIFVDNNLEPHTIYYYKVQAGNSGGLSKEVFSVITTQNSIPDVGAIEAINVVQGQYYDILAPANDADNDSITMNLSNAPSFVSTSGKHLLLSPQISDIGNYSDIMLVVTDGFGGYDTTTFSVIVLNVNAAPIIVPMPDQVLNELDVTTFTLSATDADNDSLSWTVSAAPSFASFTNLPGGKLSVNLNPSLANSGTYPIYTYVKDAKNAIAKDTLLITVIDLVPTVLYRINAGGALITSSPVNWALDKQATPVSFFDLAYSCNYTGGSTAFNFSNTTSAPNAIFGPYRLDALTKGQIRYKFPVVNAKHMVNLFFAETPYSGGATAVGQKVFHINIENSRVLSNFDPFAEAGNNAIQKQFIKPVSDGLLEVELVRNIGKPYINGLEIIQLLPATGSNNREGDFYENSNHEEIGTETGINISPNPVLDNAYLTGLSKVVGDGVAKISIQNEIGKTVFEREWNNSEVSDLVDISFSGFSSGFYILKIETSNNNPIVKTIVKR